MSGGNRLPVTKTAWCFGDEGRLSSTLGLQENPQPCRGLWGKEVTPSHFHNWVVCRQTAVFQKGKQSQLAFQVFSCKWLSGGTTVSAVQGFVPLKQALCVPLPPPSAPPLQRKRETIQETRKHTYSMGDCYFKNVLYTK